MVGEQLGYFQFSQLKCYFKDKFCTHASSIRLQQIKDNFLHVLPWRHWDTWMMGTKELLDAICIRRTESLKNLFPSCEGGNNLKFL